jgi:hypothetical protein
LVRARPGFWGFFVRFFPNSSQGASTNILEIFKDILNADEVTKILARVEKDFSGSEWTRESGKVERKNIAEDEVFDQTRQEWLSGDLEKTRFSADTKQLFIPIEKSGQGLTLVIARKKGSYFDT